MQTWINKDMDNSQMHYDVFTGRWGMVAQELNQKLKVTVSVGVLGVMCLTGCTLKTQDTAPPVSTADQNDPDPNVQSVLNDPKLSREQKAQIINNIKSAKKGLNATQSRPNSP